MQSTCPQCGEQLGQDPNSVVFSGSALKTGGRAPLVCVNPDCPGKAPEMAKAVSQDGTQ
jgi:hypothetical protein